MLTNAGAPSSLALQRLVGATAYFTFAATLLLTARVRAFTARAAAHSGARADALVAAATPTTTPMGTPMPRSGVHRVLEPKLTGKRTIIIGDVHGCCDELEVLATS
jgi:hypothetical protein